MINLFKLYSRPRELAGYQSRLLIPEFAYKEAMNGKKLTPEQLNTLAQDPRYAYYYAVCYLLKPWPQAEPAIAQDPGWAGRYALDILKRPWPLAEPAIAQDPEWAYWYARGVLKKPWPQAEPAIAQDPIYAYPYAQYVLKKPWPPENPTTAQALASMKVNPYVWDDYQKFIKSYEKKKKK